LLLFLVTATTNARAESVAALSALKAAYVVHFLNLIRWESRGPSLEFCLVGKSDAGDRMRTMLRDKRVHGQSVRVRAIARNDERGQRCDALYIPESAAAYASAVLKRYESTATVTISDVADFTSDGGIIGFVVVEDRLRFDINERVAARKQLKVSAKLLELARRVIR
jgi:hypothetical protein